MPRKADAARGQAVDIRRLQPQARMTVTSQGIRPQLIAIDPNDIRPGCVAGGWPVYIS